MWHLKTKLGTFWILETSEDNEEYLLGVNDEQLCRYKSTDAAIKDVCEQSTGYLSWDCQSRVRAPTDLSGWHEGVPDNWEA